MKKGLIYKYTNLLNGKIYIGQTRGDLNKRDNKHFTDHNNMYFDRAYQKYGKDNFKLEIVEENVDLDKLNEREKYWIKYYKSMAIDGNGYNMTSGGSYGNPNQKITNENVDKVKKLLKTTNITFAEISKTLDVGYYTICDINSGKSFFEPDIEYPIRKNPTRTKLTDNEVDDIINLLQNTKLSIDAISKKFNISEFTVGEINRGDNKTYCPRELRYPLRTTDKKYVYSNKISKYDVMNVCKELIFSNKTTTEIGKSYGIAKNTVSDISRGIAWKEITSQFCLPIRKNKEKNKDIYLLVYGIV